MPISDILAYLATGALSGLLAGLFGVGGGAIMVPALIAIYGFMGIGGDWTAHLAVGTSLATIIGTGVASTRAHQARGGVRWDLVRRLAPGIVLGAWLGSAIAGFIPGLWLKRCFALFLVYTGVKMLSKRSAKPGTDPAPLPGTLGLWGAGGGIGLLSSLVGIGGGTLTVPFLSNRGIDLRQAVGTSAACGLPIAIAGAIGFIVAGWGRAGLPEWSTGFVYWPAVVVMLLASIPTAPIGARLAHRLPILTLERLFGLLLLLVALRLGFAS